MKNYIIITGGSSQEISEKINEKISEGYQISGNILKENGLFFQPMLLDLKNRDFLLTFCEFSKNNQETPEETLREFFALE
jgi:hypothetical protein